MGRNWKKDTNAKRNKQIAVRVTEEEKDRMEDFARGSGYESISDWARTIMFADMARDASPRKKGNQGR